MTSRAPSGALRFGTRRRFLQTSAATIGAAVFPPTRLWAEDLPALDAYQPSYLTAEEWRFVRAATARLIPSEGDGPGAEEARVAVFIDLQLASGYGAAEDWYMEGPHDPAADPLLGWQSPLGPAEVYRHAIPAVEDWCASTFGKPFAELSAAEQDAALQALEAGDLPLDDAVRDFFTLLLANTKEGYFSDPMHGGNHAMQAWSYIGFPGARGTFLEWLDKPGEAYPLGPVSISGERA